MQTSPETARPQATPGAPGPRPSDRDAALVARIRSGDEAAFAELHRLYHPRVFAFALKRMGDPAEAEDVAQDVFLQVFRSLGRYQGRSSLLTWIFGIAHHETCNRFRRKRLDAVPLDDEARHVAAPQPSPDGVVDAVRTLGRCVDVLDREVSPAQRRVFELRYWDARSVEEIARDTGKSPGAVRVGLLRTRRALASAAAAPR